MKTLFCFFIVLAMFIHDVSGQYYYNRALSLPGVAGNYAVTDPGTNLSITGSFTLECWVYQTNATGAQIVIQKRLGSATSGYTLYLNAGKVVIRTNGTSRLTGATTIPLNVWTHVAASYNLTTNVFTVYVNGNADGTVTTANAAPAADADSLRLGVGFNAPFIGMMDEVRIWNVERTVSDIQATMRMPLGETGVSGPYTGLVSAWRFNKPNGGSGADEVGGNTAYLRGTATFADLTNKPNNHLAFNTGIMCTGAATGTCVQIPYSPLWNPTSEITIECWVNIVTSTDAQVILSTGSAGYPFRFLKSFNGTSYNLFRVILNGGTAMGAAPWGGTIPPGKWTHLSFTYNSTSGAFAYYMNGIQTLSGVQAAGPLLTTSNPLQIGGGTGVVTLNGMVDEVRISSFAKTSDQVLKGVFTSADTNNAANTVAYNFEGNLAEYTSNGPRGTFTGTLTGIRFTQTYNNASEFPIPTDRWDAGNFANGFWEKYSGLNFGASPSTITDSIFMPQGLTISDVNLFAAIHHTNANDISISLKNPAGSTTRILYPGGGSNVGMHMITIFDDQADSTIGGLAPWSPRVKPSNDFSVFNGQNSLGWWKLVVTDIATGSNDGILVGWGIQFNNQTIVGSEIITSNNLPKKYTLYQNYPNPFNPTTTIKYDIPKAGLVKFVIYDIIGREVSVPVNDFKQAGSYTLTFNANNLASGVYIYRIETDNFVDMKKMILVK